MTLLSAYQVACAIGGIGGSLKSAYAVGCPIRALDGIAGVHGAYALRQLLISYAGPLIRLRRDSDDAELDFGFDTNGDLDTAAITTWLGGATGFFTTSYDNSIGARDMTQPTAAAQPTFVTSPRVGMLCSSGRGLFRIISGDSLFAQTNAAAFGVTSEQTGANFDYWYSESNSAGAGVNNGAYSLGWKDSNDFHKTITYANSGVAQTINSGIIAHQPGEIHQMTSVDLNKTVSMRVDGVDGTGGSYTNVPTIDRAAMSGSIFSGGLGNGYNGVINELTLISGTITDDDRDTIENSQALYWGI